MKILKDKGVLHMTIRDTFKTDAYSNFGQETMVFSSRHDNPLHLYNNHTPSYISSTWIAKIRDKFMVGIHLSLGKPNTSFQNIPLQCHTHGNQSIHYQVTLQELMDKKYTLLHYSFIYHINTLDFIPFLWLAIINGDKHMHFDICMTTLLGTIKVIYRGMIYILFDEVHNMIKKKTHSFPF